MLLYKMSMVSPILLNFQTFCAIGLNRMLLAIYKMFSGNESHFLTSIF